jgi:hypothetical protein
LKIIENVLSTPRSIKEVLLLTNLPERTLRYNLAILRKSGNIVEIGSFSDLRKKRIYFKEAAT